MQLGLGEYLPPRVRGGHRYVGQAVGKQVEPLLELLFLRRLVLMVDLSLGLELHAPDKVARKPRAELRHATVFTASNVCQKKNSC